MRSRSAETTSDIGARRPSSEDSPTVRVESRACRSNTALSAIFTKSMSVNSRGRPSSRRARVSKSSTRTAMRVDSEEMRPMTSSTRSAGTPPIE